MPTVSVISSSSWPLRPSRMTASSRGSSGVIERTDRLTATRRSSPAARQRSACVERRLDHPQRQRPDHARVLGRLDERLGRELARARGAASARAPRRRAAGPWPSSTCGWKTSSSSPASIARPSSATSVSRSTPCSSNASEYTTRRPVRRLRPLERDVGVAQQRVEGGAVLGMAGDPGGRARRRARRRGSSPAPTSAASTRSAAATQSSTPSTRPRTSANSSPPRRAATSRGPADRRQPARDLDQHEVAAAVPERLVDLLEALEPDHQHADLPARGARRGAARARARARRPRGSRARSRGRGAPRAR